jgi:glycosyltransferase involved in cell wall biosynthesis
MRVLFVVNSVKAKFPVDLAKQFDNGPKNEVSLFPLLPNTHGKQGLFNKITFLFRLPITLAKLRKTIRETKPDVLHTHFWLADIIGALAARPFTTLKLVSTQHDEVPLPFLIRSIKTRCLRRFNKVIAISASVAKFLTSYFKIPPERVITIYNGVDIQKFSEGVKSDSAWEPVIGLIARLEPVKGGDVFIEALGILSDSSKGRLRSVILGDGTQKDLLEKRARELGLSKQVIFAGEQTNLIPSYQTLDIVVVPSRSEGLSVTILESLAAKKLVIASSVGGIPELIRHEQTGLLVPPNNPKALSEAIAWAMNNPEQALAIRERGNRWLTEKNSAFDINQTITAYIQVYANL